MLLIIASGPRVEMTPTSGEVRVWALVMIVCALVLLADAAFTAIALRRQHQHMWRRGPTLVPLALTCACSLIAWRTGGAAGMFPNVSQIGGVTGDCALCQTMNNDVWVAIIAIGATALTVLGGVVYLLGELD